MQELLDHESTSKNKSKNSPSKIKQLALPKRPSIDVDTQQRYNRIQHHSTIIGVNKKKREILNIIDMRVDNPSLQEMNKNQLVQSGKFQMQTQLQRRKESMHRKSKSVLSEYSLTSYDQLEKFGSERRGQKYYKGIGGVDINLKWDEVGIDFKALNSPPKSKYD